MTQRMLLLLLFVVCCLLFVVCCLLFVVCCLLFVVCCLLFVVCCLLFVVCCLLFVVCCLLFVVCCLLLFVVVVVLTTLLLPPSCKAWGRGPVQPQTIQPQPCHLKKTRHHNDDTHATHENHKLNTNEPQKPEVSSKPWNETEDPQSSQLVQGVLVFFC